MTDNSVDGQPCCRGLTTGLTLKLSNGGTHPMTAHPSTQPGDVVRSRPACPTCHTVAADDASVVRMREERATSWWSTSGHVPARIEVNRYCGHCQPRNQPLYIVACLNCGDGPILTGPLAQAVLDADSVQFPPAVLDELARTGWHRATTRYGTGWTCSAHQPSRPPRRCDGITA